VLDEDAEKGRFLRFEVTQNDTLGLIHPRSVLPLNGESIAGFVALTGEPQNIPDVYDLPADLPFAFNHSFDDSTGYRSKSMLVVPMRNHDEEIVGVIELINKKQARGKLRTNEITERTVTPFGPEDEEVLNAFASQAAVALDNRLLIDSIEGLFDSFIRASVMAIESRDPATAGHSERVARLTAGIAESVNEIRVGKWKTVYFSSEQLREIRYAGLLHDFGKIGVRENVLIKAKKLYDPELEIIRLRFALALRSLEASHAREQLVHAVQNGGEVPAEALTALNAEFKREASSLSDDLAAVLKANEPSVLEEATAERLAEIALHRYLDIDGNERPLLSERELAALSVRRGSLTGEEYGEVQSHVSQTFRFLSVMPWTRPLRGVPLIAGAHHEKLDGTGYPNRLKADAIPIQSKMMAIADIYDALTAADRPYKLAVPIPKALDILTDECTQGHVDRELLDIFIQRKVYEEPVTPNWPTSALIAS
jgi:HD-GYP domain-containing protein (c-di-GMP phosphodiesterase class II)